MVFLNNKFCQVFFLFLFSFSPLFGTAFSPWFGNVFEFEGRGSYLYRHSDQIQTPLGSFTDERAPSELELGLGISPWQEWNLETEVYFGSSPDISFTYEAFLLTGRYLWLEELSGDPLNLALGLTLSFPQKHFSRDFSYWYHGKVNAEAHIALGKECSNWCTFLWQSRYWILAGFGIADRGNAWIHGIASAEWLLNPCITFGLFSEGIFGLGARDIIPFAPFEGYATIAHRSIDLGAFFSYQISILGNLNVEGFYRLYAHNFPLHIYGVQVELMMPFSF